MAAKTTKTRNKNNLRRWEDKEIQLLTAAHLYAEQPDRTFGDVATAMGISRVTVARLITEARRRGYLKEQIILQAPTLPVQSLEAELRRRYTLKEAIVVSSPGRPELVRAYLASAAAKYLDGILKERPKSVVGLTGGMTIKEVITQLPEPKRDVEVVPLNILERMPHPDYASASFIGKSFAEKCRSEKLFAGIAANMAETSYADFQKERDHHIRKLSSCKLIMDKWETLDIALMSVSVPHPNSPTIRFLKKFPELNEQIKHAGAILNMLLIDKEGKAGEDLFLAIPLETLQKLAANINRDIILVSGGNAYGTADMNKTSAIKLLLQMRALNTLITDSHTAVALAEK